MYPRLRGGKTYGLKMGFARPPVLARVVRCPHREGPPSGVSISRPSGNAASEGVRRRGCGRERVRGGGELIVSSVKHIPLLNPYSTFTKQPVLNTRYLKARHWD